MLGERDGLKDLGDKIRLTRVILVALLSQMLPSGMIHAVLYRDL